TASSGLFSSGSSFGLPTQTKTCRIRTVGRSINNVCPIGFTVITNGECCITPQVSTSGSTVFPPSTISPLPPFACADRSNTNGINECPGWRSYCTNVFYRTSWPATAHKLADSISSNFQQSGPMSSPLGRSMCVQKFFLTFRFLITSRLSTARPGLLQLICLFKFY
ncbi:Protein CBG24921, partial [Caenorhabditis briggsae]